MHETTASTRAPLALIVNDQDWAARSLREILARAGYAVLRVYNGAQTLEAVRGVRPDLVLLHSHLPDMSGIQVCQMLRAEPRIRASTPILVTMEAPFARARRLEAFRAGAWELLSFPLDPEELLARLDIYVAAKLDADRVREGSLLDHLSGLYNARGLLRRAREFGAQAYRHRRPLGCAVFAPDLDHGGEAAAPEVPHETPSAVVVLLARVFQGSGRQSDAIGRVAAAEFVVIAPETGDAGIMRMAERLVGAVENAQRGEREGVPAFAMRAGCYAVGDFREASLDPVDILIRATLALRRSQADPRGAPIRFFDGAARTS